MIWKMKDVKKSVFYQIFYFNLIKIESFKTLRYLKHQSFYETY